MVEVVTLQQAKDHLRIVHSADDSLVQLYMDAAAESIENFLNRDIPGSAAPVPEIPAPIKAAALLIIGDLYENRESQVNGSIIQNNPSAMRLLYPYRVEIGI